MSENIKENISGRNNKSVEIDDRSKHGDQLEAGNDFYQIIHDIDEKCAAIEKESFTDSLTKCYNRNRYEYFRNNFPNADVNQREQLDGKVAVIYIDLNKFKHINDTYGHSAGDTVLKTVGEFLRSNFRQSDAVYINRDDIVFRPGGDEYVIVCYNNNNDQNFEENLTDKLKEMLSTKQKVKIINELDENIGIGAEIEIDFDFAFGVGVFNNATDTEGIITTSKRADKASYKMKYHPDDTSDSKTMGLKVVS